jgi:hypothetical protein
MIEELTYSQYCRANLASVLPAVDLSWLALLQLDMKSYCRASVSLPTQQVQLLPCPQRVQASHHNDGVEG